MDVGRYVNCGTVAATLGFLLFLGFGYLLVSMLCAGEGPPRSEWMRYPG